MLRHRAPLRGARDGNTVNAQVRPSDIGADLSSVTTTMSDPRPQIEVSFGAANLRRRDLIDLPRNRQRLQPMGIAADRRWAWHEFCHVLNYASFGKLEFRFAHSAGDALAAIVCDPDSALRHAAGPRADRFARHITFPWVALGRRHDRDATRGWACCGRRNLARLASSTAFDDQRRGYFEEQLLSSALFRFYCAIGGECAAHRRPPRGIRLCRLPDHAGDPGIRCDDDADPDDRRLRQRADAGRYRDRASGMSPPRGPKA